MWQKYLLIILLFFLFAVLQTSFFVQVNFWGAVPDLIFVFFFLLTFFQGKLDSNLFFYSFFAGLFSDILKAKYIGMSIVLLLVIGFLIKKIQASLSETEEKYPFYYFLIIFLVCFLGFEGLYLKTMIYSLVFAIFGFFIFKKYKFYAK